MLAPTIKRWLAGLGFEVHRLRVKPEDLLFLADVGIRTVLDVGANAGQFARKVRTVLPSATIHSFEPLPVVFAELERLASADGRMVAHPLALGERNGSATIEVNDFSPSSSLLPLDDGFKAQFPHLGRTHPVEIQVRRLDDWAAGQTLEDNLLVKLDVQGFEDRVIRGGSATLSRAVMVISEVSFAQIYRGQLRFDELHDQLRGLGFRCAGTMDSFCDSRGRILQADALFLRS